MVALRRVGFDGTWDGWRGAARGALEAGLAPASVMWEEAGDEQAALPGLAANAAVETAAPGRFRVPRRFFELGEAAACHRDPSRWDLLYRVLWRVTNGEPRLLDVAVDPDVHRLLAMEKAVRRAAHKMKAFVRFRAVEDEAGTWYVAWFEPGHRVTERVAPFFAERFPSMRWTILTPDACVHWDGESLAFAPGVPRAMAPAPDALEAAWRTYYASTFNPARLRPAAMRAEMPIRYWRNLPEAGLIAPLLADAPARVRRMIEEQDAGRVTEERLRRPGRSS